MPNEPYVPVPLPAERHGMADTARFHGCDCPNCSAALKLYEKAKARKQGESS